MKEKSKNRFTALQLPQDTEIIRSTIVSAKIEGIEINEMQLKNALERYQDAIRHNLEQNQAIGY